MDVTGNISTAEVLAIAAYMAACLALMGWYAGRRKPAAPAVPPPPTNRKRNKE